MSGKIVILKDPALHIPSNSWSVLENVLYKVCQIDPQSIHIVSAGNAIPEAEVIIAVGDQAFSSACGLKGIMKYAGTVQSYGSIPVVPVVSPGYIEHNPNYMRTFAEHIQLANNISLGLKQKEATNQFTIVKDLDTLEKVAQYCKETGYCSFDFETTELTDLSTFDKDFLPLTLSISFQIGSAYVIPLMHPESPFADITLEEVVKRLRPIFSDPSITKIGHLVKFDAHVLAWLGITEIRGPLHCTLTMHSIIDENLPHGLKPIVRDYFPQFSGYEESLGKNWKASLLDLAKYNALDSDLTLRSYWIFTDILLQSPELYLLYRNLLAPATKTLLHVEEHGMLIDKHHLVESIRKVDEMILKQENTLYDHYIVRKFNLFKKEEAKEKLIADLEEKIIKTALQEFKSKSAQDNQVLKIADMKKTIEELKTGVKDIDEPKVNFGSPLQLKELLYSKEGFGFVLPKQSMGVSENSTGKENLDLIKDKSGFIEGLQAFRQLKKVSSTYLASILDKLESQHYIHTTFNQAGTRTGRLSAKNPNLQNIITRTKFKVVEEAVSFVKQSFIVPEGYTLIAADYSQLELRLMAHFSGDQNMLKAYKNNQDLHELTASNDRGYTLEQFHGFKETDPKKYKQERFEAKASNFGNIYLISAPGFQEYARVQYGMNISLREAEKRQESFFKLYPKIKDYHKLYINKARKFGQVKTFFGRRIHLMEINSINGGKRGNDERVAVNAPIQGTGGEMGEFAMPLLENRLSPEVKIVNNVHDALYFYCPDSKIEETLPIIKSTMENLPLEQYFQKKIEDVPIQVEFESSKKSWGNLH
jgi:DNA polymerase I-like protein with 3'-5' exonuclease and polymerase domains